MIINNKILHLPPHISTSWNKVSAIFLNENKLHINLTNGTTLAIPGLTTETLELIFQSHASFLNAEQISIPQVIHNGQPSRQPQEMVHTEVVRFNLENMESLQTAMQHNPAQASMPNIPHEILNKIAQVAKIVASDDIQNIPKPEPHCNCTHCQIARAIHNQDPLQPITLTPLAPESPQDEIVSDQELVFQQWEISQIGEKLYSVINRLDKDEKYNVHLGTPIGCTCGKHGCEHILAVLKN